MAKPVNGLLAKAKELVPLSRRTWVDSLTAKQREEIREVIQAIREGKLDRTATQISKLIVETYGSKVSLTTVRKWVADQIQGGRVA